MANRANVYCEIGLMWHLIGLKNKILLHPCCVGISSPCRLLEYVDHLHDHFVYPVIMKRGNYKAPTVSVALPGSIWMSSQKTYNMYSRRSGVKVFRKRSPRRGLPLLVRATQHVYLNMTTMPLILITARTHGFQNPGYCTEMKAASLDEYEYPGGTRWQKLFADGLFK